MSRYIVRCDYFQVVISDVVTLLGQKEHHPLTELPSRRTSIQGETFEGERLRLSLSVAKKLYRCPACRQIIDIGAEHVFVHYLSAEPPYDHEHWHSGCAGTKLIRNLSSSFEVSAPKAPRPKRRGRR